ncbi:MAG: hypothetical protein IAE78_24530 [Myxococcus sp.]|nr:hypothetical protein [Myxococcus sp.]
MSAAMLLAVLLSVVGAVEMTPDAPCVDAGLAQRLASAGVVLPAGARLSLRRAPGDSLEVTLSPRAGAPMRRAVPSASRDCAAVERVVVALVKAWLTAPAMTGRFGSADGGHGSEPAGPPAQREGASAKGASERWSQGELADGGLRERTDTAASTVSVVEPRTQGDGGGARAAVNGAPSASWPGVDDGGSRERTDTAPSEGGFEALGQGDGGLPPGATAAAPPTQADAALVPSLWRFGVGLLAGVSSGTTVDVLPQGLLALEVSRGWFGVALDVGLSGQLARDVAPGRVSASWQWVTLSARATWAPLGRVLLDAQLGARAHRVGAFATGFSETKPEQQLLSLGLAGSVGGSVFVLGPVGLVVRATGVVKPPERFTIDNLGAVLDLGGLEGAVHAGVFARW